MALRILFPGAQRYEEMVGMSKREQSNRIRPEHDRDRDRSRTRAQFAIVGAFAQRWRRRTSLGSADIRKTERKRCRTDKWNEFGTAVEFVLRTTGTFELNFTFYLSLIF